MLELSQIIFGVNDLEAATARLRGMGLDVIDGGVHPGFGTANRIVPLGRQYLELLGIVDSAQARRTAYGRALAAAVSDGDRLVRWSLRTDDVEAVAARLGLVVERRQRLRPDGVRLTWRAAGLPEALEHPWLPFFMQWDDASLYPGRAAASHRSGVTHASWLEVCPGDPPRFARWIEGADASLRAIPGDPGLGRVALADVHGNVQVALP